MGGGGEQSSGWGCTKPVFPLGSPTRAGVRDSGGAGHTRPARRADGSPPPLQAPRPGRPPLGRRGAPQAEPPLRCVTAEAQRSPLPPLGTYHVNELCDGQPEVDENHVRDVGHGPGPLVVASEELLQQPFLCVGPGLHVAACCGDRRVCSSGAEDDGPSGCPLRPPTWPRLPSRSIHLRTFAHPALLLPSG